MYKALIAAAAAAMAAIVSGQKPAHAGPVSFIWDPSQATPALAAGPDAFNADGIVVTNYIRTTNVNDLTTLRQTFSGMQMQTIDAFTLGGAPVTVPGLNSSFGLYFVINPAGYFPINAGGATVGPATYTMLDVSLVADVGDNDGTLSVDASGLGFSNPAGQSNDVVLATGSLISAALSIDASGGRHAHYVTTFQPAAGEAGFFQGPAATLDWEEFLTTPAAAFSVVPVDGLTVLDIADGSKGSGGVAQLVPEPASAGLLGAGLLALAFAGRRRKADRGEAAATRPPGLA